MRFRYSTLIVPSDTKPENINDSRKFSVTSDRRFRKSDRVYKLKKKVVEDGFINSFALRNYWRLALGETTVIDRSWNSTKDLINRIDEIESVKYVKEKRDFVTKSVVLRADQGKMSDIKTKLRSMFSNKLPIYQGYECYEIILSTKWLNPDSQFFFDDVKHIW